MSSEQFGPLPKTRLAVGVALLLLLIVGAAAARDQTPPPSGQAALDALPPGVIIMWGLKRPLPAGGMWIPCDGTAGTPNLSARVPVGVPNTGSTGETGTLVHTHAIKGGTGNQGGTGHEHVLGLSTQGPTRGQPDQTTPLPGTATVVFLCKIR